ncbi:hypothetical protein SDC9_113380 [bioreactor metagenome]|uniref:Uncharacterized protein n=1 Tax=bioreactor metagenome TaxID=1076179 RepID=A0A645BTA8_9ZZZZ
MQQKVPHGDIQHTKAHHGEAHDRTGGERHPQALIQAFGCGLRRAGVGIGGNLHADKARQHGPDAAGEEGKRREFREHLPAGSKGHHQQNDKYHGKDLCHGGILVLQVGVGALPDSGRNFLHFLRSLGVAHDFFLLHPSKAKRKRKADKADPEHVFHRFSPLLFVAVIR